MFDAATIEFPFTPPAGVAEEEYLKSWAYTHEEMAYKLDILSRGKGSVGVLVTGEQGTGKTTMLKQLQDIAQRRRGGCATLTLDVRNGQSILKTLADALLAHLDKPEYAERDLAALKTAARAVATLAVQDEATFPTSKPNMKRLLTEMGEALQAAQIIFVVFIDDVNELSEIGMKYLINFVSLAQCDGYPLMFVVSGPPSVLLPIADACSEGDRLFSGFKVRGEEN